MRSCKRLIPPLVLLALAACPGSSSTQAPTPQPPVEAKDAAKPAQPAKLAELTKVRTIEGITEYRLGNGMQVLLFPDASQAKVTVNITYYVGSRHEGYGEAGMAHLLEHMVFKGTPSNPDVWKALEDHGASFNGTTWVDRTNYYETMPASPENLEFAIALEADRMINSSIDPQVLSKEFSVVRNEFEMGENNPVGVLEERLYAAAYLWHNYGKSTIGNRSDIERVPADALKAFYKKYYQPDNATLVVAGRFDEKAALDLIRQHFGAIPKPDREIAPTYTVEPVQDGERSVTLRRVGDVQAFGVVYHTVPGTHPDFVPLEAMVNLLTTVPSGRLYQKLVKKGLATRVWGSNYAWRDPGVVKLFAEVPPKKSLAKVEEIMVATIEEAGEITEEEVNRYKAKALKSWELGFTKSQQIAIQLSEFAAMGDWRLLFIYRDRIEKLTAADVQRVASTYFKRSNRTEGRFVPTKSPDRVPEIAGVDVAALVKGYKGRETITEGEKFEASVANVEKRTTRITLGNGMKLALLPKKTRGQAVRAHLTIHFGTERDVAGKSSIVSMIPEMIQRGTKKRSYQEIRDELDRLKAQVGFGGGGLFSLGDNSVTATITTTRANLPATIELVAEMLREPSFPADQFKILKEQSLTSLEESKNNPQSLGFLELIRAINPWPKGNARYVPTLDEQIAALEKVRLADLKKFHARFYGAGAAEMAIVGDFDADRVKAVIDEKLGSWKAKKPYKRIVTPHKAKKPSTQTINTPDKQMAIIGAAHTFALRDDDPDYPAVEMAGYILGGGAASRLLGRLRQKDGLSYGAFGAVQASSEDELAILFAGAICAPANLEKAMTAMNEEIDKLIADGVEAKELEDAKAAYLEKFKSSLANDNFLASQLAGDLRLGRTFQWQEKLNAKIAKLTPAQVNAAIKKYISSSKLARVSAGDLAKAGMKK